MPIPDIFLLFCAVVSGTAEVTNGNEACLFSENQSTCIPVGTKH